MNLLADDRFRDQVTLCLGTICGAQPSRPTYLTAPSSLFGTRRWKGLRAYTAWSRTTSQTEHSVLTVVIDVTLTESHSEICERRGIMHEVTKLLQALMQDIKSNTPSMFSFVLLVDCADDLIERLLRLCLAKASDTPAYCIDIILAGIVELVRKSNKRDHRCDYLTIWGDRWLKQLMLVKMEGFWALRPRNSQKG